MKYIEYGKENKEVMILLHGGGLSLGGQILLEVLLKRENICRYAFVESALAVPSKITHAMITPAFGSCYGLIKQKWFSKLQFRSLHMKPELFEEYYQDTCKITKKNRISFLQENSLYSMKEPLCECQTKVHIVVGEKERPVMKKSAKLIWKNIPGSTRQVLPGLYHGELSINHGKEYAKRLIELVRCMR